MYNEHLLGSDAYNALRQPIKVRCIMRRNRLLLCFLLGIAIVFYGAPYLQFQGDVKTTIYSVMWLLFALIAISGNLIALLYGKQMQKKNPTTGKIATHRKQKVRQYI